LTIRQTILGNNHPDTAKSYNNLALVLDEKGDYDGALEEYEKSLAIIESVFGTNHPITATVYDNIGRVLRAKGDYDGALGQFGKAMAVCESVLGKNHRDRLSPTAILLLY
jgi:tetratricopeptide (TPR) repeat protein